MLLVPLIAESPSLTSPFTPPNLLYDCKVSVDALYIF